MGVVACHDCFQLCHQHLALSLWFLCYSFPLSIYFIMMEQLISHVKCTCILTHCDLHTMLCFHVSHQLKLDHSLWFLCYYLPLSFCRFWPCLIVNLGVVQFLYKNGTFFWLWWGGWCLMWVKHAGVLECCAWISCLLTSKSLSLCLIFVCYCRF